MKIAILTSSRADYSIYLPLIQELMNDPDISLEIIAFGTHISKKYGHTVEKIIEDGFKISYEIDTMPLDDSPNAISEAMGKTINAFSVLWDKCNFDLVFCVGDRYEMFAACSASIPFNIKLAHIHGGEQTIGAIDDIFRHCLSHMSKMHFVVSHPYKKRLISLIGSNKNVFNVGALSIDNLKKLPLLSIVEFKERYNIDMNQPSVLITIHSETVSFERNIEYINESIAAFYEMNEYQLIITMPNADTMGLNIKKRLLEFIESSSNAIGIESFGTIDYLSCMKHCSFMLGNTSSGFIEASFFPKYVINMGNRQKGRIQTKNIVNCEFKKDDILLKVHAFDSIGVFPPVNIYGGGNAAKKIMKIVKQTHVKK